MSSFDPSTNFMTKPTIVRTRGIVSVFPTSAAADLNIVGAVGMGIVSDQAFDAGVASMPEPMTDANWGGWLVWHAFSYHLEFGTNASINYPRWDFEVDSKAMRKVGVNETVIIIAESTTGAFSISASLRQLYKLS